MRKHHIIFVPGLGDDNFFLRWVIKRFEGDGFITHVHPVPWKKRSEDFAPKLERIIHLIDELSKNGDLVSLVGISAGGSAVLNTYLQRKNKVSGIVNFFGRLKSEGKPSLNFAARNSSAFKESVLMFEKDEHKLTISDKKKVLTIRAMFDETVPLSTTPLKGARNIQVPLVGHAFSIYMGTLIYKKLLVNFLRLLE